MAGRPRKPTALKIRDGEKNKNRINRNEPKPEVSRPTCPQHLSGAAKYEWRRIAPELEKLGLLSQIDRAALAAYCSAYGRWVEAENQLKKLALMSPQTKGLLYKTPNDNLIINPLVRISKDSLEFMHRYLVEFGMTPASRTRITTAKDDGGGDEMEDILRGTGNWN